jgi:hypothetical protein
MTKKAKAEFGARKALMKRQLAQARFGSIMRLTEDVPAWRWQPPDRYYAEAVLAPAGSFGLVLGRSSWVVAVANPQDGWLLPFVPLRLLELYGWVRRERRRKVRVRAGGCPDLLYTYTRGDALRGRARQHELDAFARWLAEGRHLRARLVYSFASRLELIEEGLEIAALVPPGPGEPGGVETWRAPDAPFPADDPFALPAADPGVPPVLRPDEPLASAMLEAEADTPPPVVWPDRPEGLGPAAAGDEPRP